MSDEQQPPSKAPAPVWHGMVAGAGAGFITRLVLHPADTLKARLQVRGAVPSGSSFKGALPTCAALYSAEGLPGFYRGFSAVVAGVIPAQAAYFGGYELGKSLVPRSWGILGDMLTGCIAQLTAGVIFTPVDVIKERMQVQSMMTDRIGYSSAGQAALNIVRTQGVVGLMQGYWATNCVWLPWSMLYVSLFERLKSMCRDGLDLEDDATLPAHVTASSAMASAMAAGFLTHPADVIKTRLQVLTATNTAELTSLSILTALLQKEGAGALWSGLSSRLLVLGPGAALTWALYEQAKIALQGE